MRAADAVDRALGPGGARRGRRPPRDRDGARGAVARDRRAAVPRRSPRAMIDLRGRGLLGDGPLRPRVLAGPPAGPRGADGRRARGAPAVPRLRVRSTSRSRPATSALLDAVIAALDGHGGHARVRDGRARQPPSRRGVRRPLRAAAGPGVRRDVRRDRERDAQLAAAARHRRGPLRGPDRADRVQRAAERPVARRDALLLREPAPAPEQPLGDDARRRRAAAVVPVRLLPAQPHALDRVLGAVPRDGGRGRRPAPPVRRRPRSRRRSPAARSGSRSRPATRGRAASTVRVVESPGTDWTLAMRVPPGAGRRDRRRERARRRRSGERVIGLRRRVGRRRPRSPSTSSCPRP